MSLALYREFRPKNFDEIIGQDYIVRTLKNQIKNDRLTHAYLFCGPRGTGKTSTAKIFARAVNCSHLVDGNPCGKCAECVALQEVNTDIIEIDAASNNRVEEIRDLREKVGFPPMIGKYKVYIVDEVHMLTDSAFNALLKTLEEPPKHAIFILATTEIHKIPATILSRCARFDFKLIPQDILVEQLRKIFDTRGIKYDEKSLYMIAKAGEGSDRDMLSIADSVASFSDYDITSDKTQQVLGLSGRDTIKNIMISIANKDIEGVFTNVKQTLGSGKNIQVLCKEMADLTKNLIMIKVGVQDYSILDIMPGEFASYVSIAEMFSVDYLKTLFSRFAEVELELKYSLNPENLFESSCLELISFGDTQTKVTETKQPETIVKNVEIKKEEVIQDNSQIEKIWGSVLIKVKEKNLFALSNALTSVNKVSRIGNKMVITTNDAGSLELIDNKDKKLLILDIVKLFDDSIVDVLVEYDNKNLSTQDIKDNLKDIFKDKIKFN